MSNRAGPHSSATCQSVPYRSGRHLHAGNSKGPTVTGSTEDGVNDEYFAAKVNNFTWGNPSTAFTGPLAFLNSYDYIMSEGLLTGLLGASAGFQAGGTFWNRCGRTLFNASLGHLAYNVTFQNGTSRPKPVLRTAGQSRIENSQINRALGFFGPTF